MANTKMTGAVYKTVADAYSQIEIALTGIEAYAKDGVDAIVEINASTLLGEDEALAAELALLTVFNAAYLSSQSTAASTANFLAAVRAINNLVIAGADTGATNQAKLDDFIMNEVSWDGGCVPLGWANLCEDAGYTIDNWTVCSA